jgi:predicted nucleic acid-binding protein
MVDSSGWLEYFAEGKNADFYAPAIEDTTQLIVSTINIYEVFKLVYQRRGEDSALQAIAVMLQGQVMGVSIRAARESAKFSPDNKVPMADSMIYPTSRINGAFLWTQDIDFEPFEKVKFIPA